MSGTSTSRRPSTQATIDPNAPLNAEQIEAARTVEVFDKDGKKTTFGELIYDKRIVVIFIRHFWCGNCKAFVSLLGPSIPPENLPEGTSLIIIGNGSHQPIPTYIESTHSAYPIYTSPSLKLHKIFGFTSKMSGNKAGEEKDYEKDLGGSMARIWVSLVGGPVKHIEHAAYVGPKSLNGGELVFEPDGTCSFIHRMQTAADHLDLEPLAKIIGAEYIRQPSRRGSEQKEKESRKSSVGGVEKDGGRPGGQQVAAA